MGIYWVSNIKENIWIYIQYQTVKRIPLEYIQYQLEILMLVLACFLYSSSIDFHLLHEWQLDTNEWGILRWRIRWKETGVQQIAKKLIFSGLSNVCHHHSCNWSNQLLQVLYAFSSFGECVGHLVMRDGHTIDLHISFRKKLLLFSTIIFFCRSNS